MRVVCGLTSCCGLEVDVAALRLKDADYLAVDKKKIVGLVVAIKQPLG